MKAVHLLVSRDLTLYHYMGFPMQQSLFHIKKKMNIEVLMMRVPVRGFADLAETKKNQKSI